MILENDELLLFYFLFFHVCLNLTDDILVVNFDLENLFGCLAF